MVEHFGTAHGVVVPVQVDPTGVAGPTQRVAAGPEWRRSSRGLYVPTCVEPSPVQRVAEVGRLLPAYATPTGWASLCWQGGWWFAGVAHDGRTALPVPVAAPGRLLRAQPGFTVCEERWSPLDVDIVDGLPVAEAVRAVCFAMRYAASLVDAVIALDLAAFHDLVSIAEATSWVGAHAGYTGIQRARDALALADENAWSPQEPRLRLLLVRHGLGPFLCNHPVFDLHGRLLGTPDLIDRASGVAIEYDGSLHLQGVRRAVDLRREHDFRSHGLHPVSMVAHDWRQPEAFLMRVRGAYSDAEAQPNERRRWTVELPSWWTPTMTVEQRRGLTDLGRARLLRHRQSPPPDGMTG